MRRALFGMILLVWLAGSSGLAAQGGDGSLRGAVQDDQGGALPDVTVTATSPALLSPSLAISDAVGNYRLVNLPPGTYTLTAELAGFSVVRREGILLRAGANCQVDITMALCMLEDTTQQHPEPAQRRPRHGIRSWRREPRYNTVAYLQPGNLQAARSFQLDLLFRF